ncbi:DUF86 domain-containing protein [Ancylobacter sp. SL191]|uniref:HepT-like ribonuclease domain-containing protein n=1 Tax=Ancylobacter sp. SL191 TaxID=2995166 RepID=UPI002270ED55|nr:HepT-like ribonuclease domain-containing protein [Ancylobacter sp. SL191]WAC28844.1 DUF86 domain-containing protein [Ancylobacter sp. SL191]
MDERAIFRLRDMKASIDNIHDLLDGRSFETMYGDAATRAAFERFLEILSEASRHIPLAWKEASADRIPWKKIADLGNHIRHAYHKLDAELLWNIYENDLDALEDAILAMLTRYEAGV